MTGGTEHFDSIDEAATAVGESAEDLADQLAELEATVTSESPWGEDEAGTLFGMAYTATLSHALETLGSHVALLFEGAQRMSVWGETSRETEDVNAEQADSVETDVMEV